MLTSFLRRTNKLKLNKPSNKRNSIIFASVFALIGVIALVSSFAATSSDTKVVEAEGASLSGAVARVSDTGASEGQYLEFGSAAGGEVMTASSISQYGITWTFDTKYSVGQFVNGDWWVVGPVTITSITPDAAAGMNGWEVNPSTVSKHALDSRAFGYDSLLLPSLPISVQPESSILKAISDPDASSSSEGCRPCLETAAVLTVVAAPPQDNGATIFRPAYFGGDKQYYSTTSLQTQLLPSLASVANAPTLGDMADNLQRVQVDHRENWSARAIHPSLNMPTYGADIAKNTGDVALRLMLDDPIEDKMPILINYLQAGIDFYGMLEGGVSWQAAGGHTNGRKLPITFAAVILDDQAMKDAVGSAPYNTFSEDGQTYYSSVADNGNGKALWGEPCSESDYWRKYETGSGKRTCRDPYGYVDGGATEIGGAYQTCCTSMPWKGTALALHLMPELKQTWSYDPFFEYVDRWVTFGTWASPDPCALSVPSPKVGICDPGSGRWSAKHGTNANAGAYSSQFANAMWDAYR